VTTSLLAEGFLGSKRFDEGLAILDERFDASAAQRRLSLVPENLRIRAELFLATNDKHEVAALHLLRRAKAFAHEQESPRFRVADDCKSSARPEQPAAIRPKRQQGRKAT
jgi:hypothetical protein